MPVLEATIEDAVQVESRKRALISELFDEIQALAHALWQERGSPHGSDWVDWYAAEEHIVAAAQTPPLR